MHRVILCKDSWLIAAHSQSEHHRDTTFPIFSMECTICKRKFLQKKYLDQHAKIHQKHKPFQCSVCPKRFHRKADKSTHERLHAPGQTRINFTAPRSVAPTPDVPTPRPSAPGPSGGAIGSRKRPHPEPVTGPGPNPNKLRIYQVAAAFKNSTITWKLN